MKVSNYSISIFISALIATCLVVPSLSFGLTLSAIDGDFLNPAPGSAVTTSPDGNTIMWGGSTGSGQSGFTFTESGVPQSDVTAPFNFNIGTFTHVNNPITGTSLTSVDLSIALTFAGVGNATFVFDIDFDETPNTGGGNCCNDIVTFTNFGVASGPVTIGSTNYNAQLLFDGSTTFQTVEGQATSRRLSLALNETPSSSAVPEPGTVILFGTGLAGLAAWRMRTGKKA